MTAVLVPITSYKNQKQFTQLAETLGEKVIVLTKEQMEDFAFGAFIKKNDSGKIVSKATILKKLSKKLLSLISIGTSHNIFRKLKMPNS